jgi:hypothetical protein
MEAAPNRRETLRPRVSKADGTIQVAKYIDREEEATKLVLPTDPKEEEVKLGSASKWGRAQLDCLRVDVSHLWKDDFNLDEEVLCVKKSEWTPVQHECTTHGIG